MTRLLCKLYSYKLLSTTPKEIDYKINIKCDVQMFFHPILVKIDSVIVLILLFVLKMNHNSSLLPILQLTFVSMNSGIRRKMTWHSNLSHRMRQFEQHSSRPIITSGVNE